MALGSLNKGSLLQNTGGSGGSATEVALLSVTTAPSGSFAVGSKYYNSSTKKIVTAVTADTWTGATSADPVFNTIYTYDSVYYAWDGNSLEETGLNLYILKSSLESGVVATNLDTIVKNGFYTCYGTATGVPSVDYSWFVIHQNSNVNTASATQRAVAYYKDSMIVYERVKTSSAWGSWIQCSSGSSGVPFSIKSANIGTKGEVDIFGVSSIPNIYTVGCSFSGTVATGGQGKYVSLLKTAPLETADSWEIRLPKFTPNGGGSERWVLGNRNGSYYKCPMMYLDSNNEILLMGSSNGANLDIFNNTETDIILSDGTPYWLIFGYNVATGYKLDLSTDGINFSTVWSSATTTKCYCKIPFMFLNHLANYNGYSNGTMDFSTGEIIINGTTWWQGNATNSLSFKVDDGTNFAPLKVINPSGTEVTLTSITALDLSGFSDGVINIFATATGAIPRQNKIFIQTAEPTPENDGDVWINGNAIKDWNASENEWVVSTIIAVLGQIIKNGIIQNGYCFPLNYNGKSEMVYYNQLDGNVEVNITAKAGFKFYGEYKDYFEAIGSPVTSCYGTNYFVTLTMPSIVNEQGIYSLGINSVSKEFFEIGTNFSSTAYLNLRIKGYLTI